MSAFTQVHTSKRFKLNTTRKQDGNEFIYLKGVTSTVANDAVTYDELGVSTLLAANAIGPVAFAMAAVDASTKFGWYQIAGNATANIVANSADNTRVGRETTDGKVGDGRAAGDEIYNCVQRVATTGAASGAVQIRYPFVDDVNGA